MTDQKRYIDTARGIAILLVILGHSITEDMAAASLPALVLRTFVYSVHMPIFFFISGYLFQIKEQDYFSSPLMKYTVSKFRRLMVPYISFSIINYLILYAAALVPSISGILESHGYVCGSITDSLFQILTFQGHLDTHLWFCYVMFLILCINRLFIRNNTCITLMMMLAVYAIWSMWKTSGGDVPYLASQCMHYLYVFCAGRLWSRYECSQEKRGKSIQNQLVYMSGLILAAAFTAQMAAEKARMIPLKSALLPLVELSGCVFIIFFISKKLVLAKTAISLHMSDFLEYTGRSDVSFPIYLLHMPFIVSGSVVVLSKAGLPMPLVIILSTLIGFVTSLLIRKLLYVSSLLKTLLFGISSQNKY